MTIHAALQLLMATDFKSDVASHNTTGLILLRATQRQGSVLTRAAFAQA